ncbi:MAG: hypothetical protein JSW51_03995 [Gemmatimonadota bacterium]|nr:MAG: hypothetical protein JSW51_03995 [Gemmatimonadota bacterium]
MGQYQLITRGEGPKLRLLLLNTATGHVYLADPQGEDPEWQPLITKSPPMKTVTLKKGVDESG